MVISEIYASSCYVFLICDILIQWSPKISSAQFALSDGRASIIIQAAAQQPQHQQPRAQVGGGVSWPLIGRPAASVTAE